MAEDVIPNLAFDTAAIGAACCRIRKAMLPAKKRPAQAFGSGLTVFFVDVPFFATELAEVRIEPQPGFSSAGEQSQPLC